MAEPFLGEVRIFSFPFAPRYWVQCNGQILAIAQNQALFSLLGTMYGGNGVQTFALPDLRGAVTLGMSANNQYVQGQTAGEYAHTLTVNEIPMHNHMATAVASAGTLPSPEGNLPAQDPGGALMYGSNPDTLLAPNAIRGGGSAQPHNNLMPYNTLNFCMAVFSGIYPSRN